MRERPTWERRGRWAAASDVKRGTLVDREGGDDEPEAPDPEHGGGPEAPARAGGRAALVDEHAVMQALDRRGQRDRAEPAGIQPGADLERPRGRLLYTSPSPRDRTKTRMPASA